MARANTGTPSDITQSLRALASLEAEGGRIPAAESLYADALTRARRLPVDSTLLGALPAGVGSLQLDKGDFPAAEVTLRQALAMQQRVAGDSSAAVAATLNNLGVALGQQNRWTEAIPLREQAHETSARRS